ncbi:type II secretion system F family protein [Desulfofundulus sp. TPOSR]|nr:type II secretion system F family protein [Desulfofundulus sp. TPOSR]
MILSAAAFFLAIAFFLLGLYQALWGERLQISQRVEEVLGAPALSFREQELKAPFLQRVVRPVLRKMIGLAGVFIPAEKTAVLEEKLNRAGRPGGLSAGEYALLKYFTAGAAGVFSFFFSGTVHLEPVQTCLLSFLGVLLGWHLPNFYLEARIRDRAELIRKELPDVLDLLTVSVEAGLGFDGALLKVAEKKKGLLAKEFSQILREINMGKPRREALRDAAERLGVDEFSSFAGSIIVADRLGISIGNVLRAQSAQMRNKRRQRAEERAMKAPVKMLFPMVFFIFPAVFLVLLGPAVIKISKVFTR